MTGFPLAFRDSPSGGEHAEDPRGRGVRVVFLIDGLGQGGAQRHLLVLLRNLDRERVEPTLWCLQKKGALVPQFERLGIPIVDLAFEKESIVSARAMLSLGPLWRRLRRLRPDVVHTYLFSPNLYGILLGALARVPVLVSSRRDMAWWEARRHLHATRLANLFVDRVVAVSESVRRHCIEREGLRPERVVTVPNGIDLAEFDVARDQEPPWRRPPGAGPVLAMTAGFRPVKGHEHLLAALAILKPRHPGLCCLLIGDGPRRQELESQARRLGVEENVVFLGWQGNVAPLLDQVDVFVLSSTSEGQSNAILEAMAAGRPVVATDVGGNPDTVENGATGLLVPPGSPERLAEAIGALQADPARARALGANGRARVERLFSARAMARSLEGLYAGLVGAAAPGPAAGGSTPRPPA